MNIYLVGRRQSCNLENKLSMSVTTKKILSETFVEFTRQASQANPININLFFGFQIVSF